MIKLAIKLSQVFSILIGLSGLAYADITDSGNGVLQGTFTVVGNAFGVGGSTLAVKNGNVGVGTTDPATKLHCSTCTILVDGMAAQAIVDDSSSNPQYRLNEAGVFKGELQTASGIAYLDGVSGIRLRGNAATTHLSITSGGNVGIGTTSPPTIFDVKTGSNHDWGIANGTLGPQILAQNDAGSAYVLGHIDANPLSLNYYSGAAVVIGTTSTNSNAAVLDLEELQGSRQLRIGRYGDASAGAFEFGGDINGLRIFSAAQGIVSVTELMRIQQNGNVGIGNTNPAYRLDVSSWVNASGMYSVAGFFTTSDAAFKENVKPLEKVLPKLAQIRAVSFDWNAKMKEMERGSEGKQIGLIAQEVEKEFPELVSIWRAPISYRQIRETDRREGRDIVRESKAPDKWGDFRSLDYGRFTAVLLEAIQEQQKEIEESKIRETEMQKKIDALSQKIR